MKIEVLGNTLDHEQTIAATTNNENTMIIAGAGSGKSLTMVGKVKYLVTQEHINIDDILCITFTNNAAESLQKKIKKELKLKNQVYTFHKLALEIIKSHNIPYSIAEDNLLDFLIDEVLTSIPSKTYFRNIFFTRNYETTKAFQNYKKTIARFIRLFIANFYDLKKFDKIIKDAKTMDRPFLKIIQKIYEMYLIEKKSQNLIDFDDMIYLATSLVKNKGLNKTYKYIIIDEYQDTSRVRENLIKEIIQKTHAYITVVGDDFQSIYRFSGCDLFNFLDFPENFKPVKKLYLTSTYRNSQELINVAGSFVMENKRQIKKNLTSKKSIPKPITILYYEDGKKDFLKALKYINSPNLLILGRNNLDIYNVAPPNIIKNNNITYLDTNTYYKTIHKAKGLEEENVLIINLTDDSNSLPSKIKEEKIINYVLVHKDLFPYEEERRLFYVALTRTKNNCYLFVEKNNPSIFVKELTKKYKKYLKCIKL